MFNRLGVLNTFFTYIFGLLTIYLTVDRACELISLLLTGQLVDYWTPIQYAKHFDISNNIMIGSTMALMRIPASSSVKMNINNNVFVQEKNGILLTEMEWNKDSVTWYMMKDAKNN